MDETFSGKHKGKTPSKCIWQWLSNMHTSSELVWKLSHVQPALLTATWNLFVSYKVYSDVINASVLQ